MTDKIIKLYCDDREDKKRLAHVERTYPELKPMTLRMDMGDYIYQSENGESVVFEYKTGNDFISSVLDNRIFNQVYELSTHYKYHYVVIAVSDWEYLLNSLKYQAGVHYTLDQVYGAISRVNCYTTVITAKNTSHAFKLMLKQAEKIINTEYPHPRYSVKTENTALNYLTAMRGLGKYAETIVDTLQLHTLNDLFNVTKEELTSIDGIGDKKAESILEKIK